MNGVHDLGGLQDMGNVVIERDEPVFHQPWEGRVYGLNRAAAPVGKWNLDQTRYAVEMIPAAEYLRMSYYERWHARLVTLLLEKQMVTRTEIESGRAAPGSHKLVPAMKGGPITVMAPANPERPKAEATARFKEGQAVRARNMNPSHHTRLPRYARGKQGVIARVQGIFVFADTNAHGQGEHPQYVYSVRFAATELWGREASSRDSVHLDLWDSYLESA